MALSNDTSLLLSPGRRLGVSGDLRLLGGNGAGDGDGDEGVHYSKRFEQRREDEVHAWRMSVATRLFCVGTKQPEENDLMVEATVLYAALALENWTRQKLMDHKVLGWWKRGMTMR